jgi:predicted Fe-Mo cluster-binding NifX family protein
MKVAISATGTTLDAEVDPRFGRCQYFIIVDPETMDFEALDNASAMAAGGAGISTAQMVAGKGVQVVLTGNSGPNAYQVLSAAGIQVITGVAGKVKDAIQAYKSGRLQATSRSNVAAHFGMGGGMGRGMGMGKGIGRGMGMGAGMMPPPPSSPEQELEALKAQSQMLAQQLSEIERRIKELEKKGE